MYSGLKERLRRVRKNKPVTGRQPKVISIRNIREGSPLFFFYLYTFIKIFKN